MVFGDLILGLLWAVAAAALFWSCARSGMEITYVTLADGRRQERRLPYLFRLLLPLAPNLTPLFGRPVFQKTVEKTRARIISAGFEGVIRAEELIALRILLPVVAGPVFMVGVYLVFQLLPGRLGELLSAQRNVFFLILLLLFYLQPALWLKGALKARHGSMERALPFVLDLLTLSVEAGLDFMTAIQRVVERRAIDPLSEEFIRMFRQVQLGKTRREALREMAERTGQTDIRSVVAALTQADELGVSIGAIVRIQAEQMRNRRFQRAEQAANEAPIKMLFPLVAFIFPCVFIVLLGPVILEFMKQGF